MKAPRPGKKFFSRRLEDGTITYDMVADASKNDPGCQELLFSILIPLFIRQVKAAWSRNQLKASPDLIDDLVCDLVLHFLERRKDDRPRFALWLDNPIAPFEHWVAAVSANRLCTLIWRIMRRSNTEVEYSDEVLSDIPTDTPENNEKAEVLQRCLDSLVPDHRRVLVMRYIEGMSSAKIGKKMGLSTDAVYKLTHKAKAELRQLISKEASNFEF